MFSDQSAGSGQMEIGDLGPTFGWPDAATHPDLAMLRRLAGLSSYDVYSLRILLRENDIPIDDMTQLRLSPETTRELTHTMTAFTRPLIHEIYGESDLAIDDFADVIWLFRDPDVRQARRKLEVMARKLDLSLAHVPKFLEDYGDIFLSLGYFQSCLDRIEPTVSQFLESMGDIRSNWQLRNDPSLMRTCAVIKTTLNELMAAITGRFESFDRSTGNLSPNVTAERFRKVETLIKSHHTTIGGVLCALSVKMDAWQKLFPAPGTGGPLKRSEFIMSEMKHGIENILAIERAAPSISELN